jgi:NAD(P)H-hydrate repair Nnr-like enzyme with NAD(P)H-hydrate dehydratase domain
MKGLGVLAMALIAAGALGLIHGRFSDTKESHKAEAGSLELAVNDKETVNVPQWAAVVAIALGAGLFVMASRKA